MFISQAWIYSASSPFLLQGGSKISADPLHRWLLWGEDAERPIIQSAENKTRDCLHATGLLPQADKHPEVSRFQCVQICQRCWLQHSAEMPESIKMNNLGSRTTIRVKPRTKRLIELFIKGKKYVYFWTVKKGKYTFSLSFLGDSSQPIKKKYIIIIKKW